MNAVQYCRKLPDPKDLLTYVVQRGTVPRCASGDCLQMAGVAAGLRSLSLRSRGNVMENLWAPWRLSYVVAEKPPKPDDPCFICQGVSGKDDRGSLIVLPSQIPRRLR